MTVVIREFGYLYCKECSPPQTVSAVPKSAFEWLVETHCESGLEDRPAFFRRVRHKRQDVLQARKYVGVLRTPCGTQVEILPKALRNDEDVAFTRRWLLRMLASLPQWRDVFLRDTPVNVEMVRRPLLDEFIRLFLQAVKRLVKRGIRFDYVAQMSNERFLRGRLLLTQHVRTNMVRRDRFYVEYDAYVSDRPANRLLKSALKKVKTWSSDLNDQRLCRELLFAFDDIPESQDFRGDLARCGGGRDLIDYRVPLGWAKPILLGLTPVTTAGMNDGLSLLFPINELFESYVTQQLRQLIRDPFSLFAQPKDHWLVEHLERRRFQLNPDMKIGLWGRTLVVLDAKWKRVSSKEAAKDYDLKQTDFYQMYAYGRKYLEDGGELFLVYPKNSNFSQPLAPFDFDKNLRLHVVPFDMDTGQLEPTARDMLLAAVGGARDMKNQAA